MPGFGREHRQLEFAKITQNHGQDKTFSSKTDTVFYEYEKTHMTCTVSISERSIQFLVLLVQEIVKDFLRPLQVSSPYDTD